MMISISLSHEYSQRKVFFDCSQVNCEVVQISNF
jgi:hypothetical protein